MQRIFRPQSWGSGEGSTSQVVIRSLLFSRSQISDYRLSNRFSVLSGFNVPPNYLCQPTSPIPIISSHWWRTLSRLNQHIPSFPALPFRTIRTGSLRTEWYLPSTVHWQWTGLRSVDDSELTFSSDRTGRKERSPPWWRMVRTSLHSHRKARHNSGQVQPSLALCV